MPGGRPSKYKSEYCEMLILHMSQGLSFDSFGGVVNVSRETLYEWTRVHKEFSDTKKIAWTGYLLWWEKKGNEGMSGKIKNFSAPTWIYNMKCRFRGDWLAADMVQDREEEKYEVKGIPKVDDSCPTE